MKLEELKGSTKNYVATWINKGIVSEESKSDLNIILNNHEKVSEYIIETFDRLNTLRLSFISLANLFKFIRGDKNKKYILYMQKAHEYGLKQSKLDKKGILSESMKKNMITFEQLIKKREQYKLLFKKNPHDNKVNLQYLILCLYSYESPKRRNYIDMEIKSRKIGLKDNKNYLIKYVNDKYIIIFNDKTSKIKGKAEMELTKILGKIISKSLKEYPRKYLLSLINNGEKPLGVQMFERLMYDIFKPKKVGVNILRHIYIENFNKKNPTMESREKLAKSMRHNLGTALMYYDKDQSRNENTIIEGKIL